MNEYLASSIVNKLEDYYSKNKNFNIDKFNTYLDSKEKEVFTIKYPKSIMINNSGIKLDDNGYVKSIYTDEFSYDLSSKNIPITKVVSILEKYHMHELSDIVDYLIRKVNKNKIIINNIVGFTIKDLNFKGEYNTSKRIMKDFDVKLDNYKTKSI